MEKISRLFVFLVAITALLFVTSCTDSTQQKNQQLMFVGGTIGLNAYLMDGMPPEMTYDGGNSPFAFGVAIENKGETDVGPGTDNPFLMVRLEGVNPEQFGMTDADMRKMVDVPLAGAQRNFDGTIFPGEMTVVTFEPLNYMPDIHGNVQFTIRADICYDYETIGSAQICIKDDVLESVEDTSLCLVRGEKVVQNSGGPLQVTHVTENPMAQNKIQVNFVIEHVGIGEFFGRPADGSEEICDFSIRNFNKFYVDVEVEQLIDSGLTVSCARFGGGRTGRLKLYQGAPTTISCTIERTRPSSGRVFQDLLNIRLRYRYGQFIETPIIVQDVAV
jgi:hypothetical protein